LNEDQSQPVAENLEPEPAPRAELITVKISSDCMCFVADCPLHSEAAEMFLGLKRALDAANRAEIELESMLGPESGMDELHKRVSEVIAALELPLSKLSERVILR